MVQFVSDGRKDWWAGGIWSRRHQITEQAKDARRVNYFRTWLLPETARSVEFIEMNWPGEMDWQRLARTWAELTTTYGPNAEAEPVGRIHSGRHRDVPQIGTAISKGRSRPAELPRALC